MMTDKIQKLYDRYKSVSDNKIRKHLETIKLVRIDDKGIGSTRGYYELMQDTLKKIDEDPRSVPLTFEGSKTSDNLLSGLEIIKTISYLVKCNSRFFLKPDIGEIFDQIDDEDIEHVAAICINDAHSLIEDTQGEHFVMTATLLRKSDK